MRQTMVDAWHCLDRVVPEGMSQVSRRSEVVYINGASSTPGYLLALWRELSHVLRGLFYRNLQRRSRYKQRTKLVFCTNSKKGSESRSSRFEQKISLISFSRDSGPPLKTGFNWIPKHARAFQQTQPYRVKAASI